MSSMTQGRCLAMWSGPRNLSTAMMRAWENRSDTQVVDEPLYAHYLSATGIDHPMADEIIAHGNTDWQAVVKELGQPPASGIFYQKHITTHWMPYFDHEWIKQIEHAFLIRDPIRVVASYTAKRDQTSASDLGYAQQGALFDHLVEKLGTAPPVIDSALFLDDPEDQLNKLCTSLSLEFKPSMLSWPAGVRETDGIWQAHWYDSVKASTCFAAKPSEAAGQENATLLASMSEHQQSLVEACMPHYKRMLTHAIGGSKT